MLEGEDAVASDIRATALEVVELLGGHPLALDQAGAYIQGTGVSFTDYVTRYHKERRRLLNRHRSQASKDSEHSRHPLPVAATLELSFREACEVHPLATDILHFCAFLHPDAIPEELFQYDNNFKFGTTAFDDGIEALRRYSLIKSNTKERTFSVHRLVQAVLIDIMSPDFQKQWRERVVRTVKTAFQPPIWGSSDLYHHFVPHVLACAAWTDDELTPTLGVADYFFRIGDYLSHIHYDSESETLLMRALSIYEQHLGFEHPIVADTLTDLAILYFFMPGKHGQVEPHLVRALSIRKKQLGTEHFSTFSSLCNLASLYLDQGKDGQAELFFRQALDVCEKFLDGHVIRQPVKGLAILLHKQGKHEEAETLLQRFLSIVEQRAATNPTSPNIHAYMSYYKERLREGDGVSFSNVLQPWTNL